MVAANRPSVRSESASLYRAAWWLGPHTATLWGRLVRQEPDPVIRLEQWDTPDGDFLEVARLAPAGDPGVSPRLLLLHGLEGGLHSHYARGLFRECARRGWGMDMLLFRTCGPTPNRLPRSYHSGETTDPAFVIARLAGESSAPLGIVGVSLGGNVLCKLLGEAGSAGGAATPPLSLPSIVRGAVAVSVPYDLARASRHIGRGFGAVYERTFLKSLIPKALDKISRHAELAPLEQVQHARTLWEFDDLFTAPLHGFDDAADYYAKASALQFIGAAEVPTLLLSAVDDPFLPPAVLTDVADAVQGNAHITVEFPRKGGHVGFVSGTLPWRAEYYGESRPVQYLERLLTR